MGDRTRIEWTDATWNPVRGCSLVSTGCANCYAMRDAHRFAGPGQPYDGLTRLAEHGPVWTGEVRLVPELLDQPLRWKKPRRIFVNSMSDLFHEDVPDEFIGHVFVEMATARQHMFQVLTKRPARMKRLLSKPPLSFPIAMIVGDTLPNVWLGVSVEDQVTADIRIPLLLRTPAAVRWVSAEPLLGPVDLAGFSPFDAGDPRGPGTNLSRLDWLVCGGESGPGARPMDPDWVRSTRDQCVAARVPFFFKQWGEWLPSGQDDAEGHSQQTDQDYARAGKKAAGRRLDGRTWEEYPR